MGLIFLNFFITKSVVVLDRVGEGPEGGGLRDRDGAGAGRGGVLWSRRWIMFCY